MASKVYSVHFCQEASLPVRFVFRTQSGGLSELYVYSFIFENRLKSRKSKYFIVLQVYTYIDLFFYFF